MGVQGGYGGTVSVFTSSYQCDFSGCFRVPNVCVASIVEWGKAAFFKNRIDFDPENFAIWPHNPPLVGLIFRIYIPQSDLLQNVLCTP